VTSQILAKRYARALLTLGEQDGNRQLYGEELNRFVDFWLQNPEFADAVSNPLYPKENRKAICRTVIQKMEFTPVFGALVDLMIEKNRLQIIADVRTYYQKLLDDLANVSRAKVISAAPLPDEAVENIKAALEKVTGRSIMVETEQDPELIGGVVARVGDLVFDGSVKTQLMSIKENLMKG